jgi:hypothetical protein
MSGMRDHGIYEFDCEWEYDYYHRDVYGDAATKMKGFEKKTFRIICDKYHPEIAETILMTRFKHSGLIVGTLRITARRIHGIDAFIQEHIW